MAKQTMREGGREVRIAEWQEGRGVEKDSKGSCRNR